MRDPRRRDQLTVLSRVHDHRHNRDDWYVDDLQLRNGSAPDFADQIGEWTTDGNFVDANYGNTIQVGNTYYRYGVAWGCGFLWPATPLAYCGIAVYSTTDFSNKGWTYVGLLFDPALCPSGECGRPKMIHNIANNNWVFWTGYGGAAEVFVCTSPTGGATPTTPGTGCTRQADFSQGGGDINLYVDPTTNIAYMLNTSVIYQLDSSYTSVVASGSFRCWRRSSLNVLASWHLLRSLWPVVSKL